MKISKRQLRRIIRETYRKVIFESNERDLTEDEQDELQYQLSFLGSTAFYSEPYVYMTPQGDVGVEGIQIGFVDDVDFDPGMGESYPSFQNPPADMAGADQILDCFDSLWVSEFPLVDVELTGYGYTPDLGNGYAEFSLVVGAEILADA